MTCPDRHARARRRTSQWDQLIAIGVQRVPDMPPLALANCPACGSTLARPLKEPAR